MPSAARQRLPSELWRCGKSQSYSPVPGNPSTFYEMQVSPGHYDVPKEKQQYHGSKRGSSKSLKHFNQERRSPKSFQRKGSGACTLSDSESEVLHSLCSGKSVAGVTQLSSSPQSDCGLNYTTQAGSGDIYAMESSPAPDPSELPYPPLEWLQPSTGKTSPVSPDFGSFNLQNIFGCTAMA